MKKFSVILFSLTMFLSLNVALADGGQSSVPFLYKTSRPSMMVSAGHKLPPSISCTVYNDKVVLAKTLGVQVIEVKSISIDNSVQLYIDIVLKAVAQGHKPDLVAIPSTISDTAYGIVDKNANANGGLILAGTMFRQTVGTKTTPDDSSFAAPNVLADVLDSLCN